MSLPIPPEWRPPTWSQETLFPYHAVDSVLRLGAVPSLGHWQAQVEVHDSLSGALVAMHSWPCLTEQTFERRLSEICGVTAELLRTLTSPF